MTPQAPKLRSRHIDLLLLSIIRSYKHPARKSEVERLAAARLALFGEKRGRGRAMSFDDLALFKINAEVRKDEMKELRLALAKLDRKRKTPEWKAEVAREPMKIREAARRFTGLAGSSENVDSGAVEDRLRSKVRTPLTAREMAEIEALFDPDAPHTRTMIAILELFEDLGIQSESIWDLKT